LATKFYLPSTGSTDIDPAWSASWYGTTEMSPSKLAAVTTKISSADATKTLTDADLTDRHYCAGMWVSARLAAQTIAAQTIGISIKCSEDNAKNNMFLHGIIRVVQIDGVTYRGTLLSFFEDNTEFPLTASRASRYYSATSSALVVYAGDRIVIELGPGGDPQTGGGSHNSDMIIGDNNGSDLDAADADTTGDPWVNFANTLTFYTAGTVNFECTGATASATPTLSKLDRTRSFALGGCAGTATPTILKLNRTRPFIFGGCSASSTAVISILTRAKQFVLGTCNATSSVVMTKIDRVAAIVASGCDAVSTAILDQLDIVAGGLKQFVFGGV